MVFGELLGGLAIRGGQRMHEDLLHQRQVEDWQREQDLGNWQNFVAKNWDNLDADQQTATINRGAQILGKKPKDFEFMVNAARAIHSTIPSAPSAPALGGPRSGPVTSTPSTEPSVGGIAAPAQIQIGQIPQPSETATPSIFAPTPEHMVSTPSMTPNEVTAQRKQANDQLLRRQMANEINVAPIPPDLREAAIAHQYGVNAVPVISSGINAASKERIANEKSDQIKASPRFIIRGDQQLPIYRRGQVETYFDPEAGQETQYQFRPGDKVYEKAAGATSGIQLIQDDRGTYAVNKAGAMAGTPGSVSKVPGLTGRPQPQSQILTTTTAEGPAIAEYNPTRGAGGGKLKVIQQGAVKGTVPGIEGGVAKEIAGLGTAYRSMSELQKLLPQVATGPLWGRFRSVEMRHLGGWGATPEEIQVATQMNMLMRTAFDTAGASLTEHEKAIFAGIFPGPNDTLETALVKIPESIKYIQGRMSDRKGLLTPMQRSQTQLPDVGANTPKVGERKTFPNGKQGEWDGRGWKVVAPAAGAR